MSPDDCGQPRADPADAVRPMSPRGNRIVTCHQPTYLPWAGLFHKLALADCFVLMDTVAFSRSGWQSRNRIKGAGGTFWLTVPLVHESFRHGRLDAVEIDCGSSARNWQDRHWKALRHCYSKAPYWKHYSQRFEKIYQGQQWKYLCDLNLTLVETLLEAFDLEVGIVRARDLEPQGKKSGLILDQCLRTEAAVYISGANGKDYLISSDFDAHGIRILHQDYQAKPYPQLFGDFTPNLSAVDILFNCGPDSAQLLLANNISRDDISVSLSEDRWPPTPDGRGR